MRMISRNIVSGYGLMNSLGLPVTSGTESIVETVVAPLEASKRTSLGTSMEAFSELETISVGASVGESSFTIPTARQRCFPQRLNEENFLPAAYLFMRLARRMEERLFDLYRQGFVKGTVTQGIGNEAAAIGATFSLRPGVDIVSLLHRDLGAHLLLGSTPYQLFCQYLGNADSPTAAREGNVHHGDAAHRRFPMISHLGGMLSTVVGATWSAQRLGENVFGLAVIGDGGSSTGAFHEAVNLASVFQVPMIFLIENNSYAFSTPVEHQYRCEHLSDRAAGYGAIGETIDGTDVWAVYEAVTRHLSRMSHGKGGPVLLEVNTCRLVGHAVYDSAKYVDPERMAAWRLRDPLVRARRALAERVGLTEPEICAIEEEVEAELDTSQEQAMAVGRPVVPKETVIASEIEGNERDATSESRIRAAWPVAIPPMMAYHTDRVKMGEAVRSSLDYLLNYDDRAVLLGLDIGEYGSAFRTCRGLYEKYPLRVIDMPLCEAGITGFALGASQTGTRPVVEYQFADFATDATTQIGLNSATWFWRSGSPAPMLLRMPCGGGVTMGPFHSMECDGLWARFPGIRVFYPTTPQEVFESLVGGFLDPNPVCVLEHKQLYWSESGAIDFTGDVEELRRQLWRPRCHRRNPNVTGEGLTIVATGAMLRECEKSIKLVERNGVATDGVELWNPFVLNPSYWGPIVESVRRTGRLLVVQESGGFQGLADSVVRKVTEDAFESLRSSPRVVAAPEEPVPFAPELESVYRPEATTIEMAIQSFLLSPFHSNPLRVGYTKLT